MASQPTTNNKHLWMMDNNRHTMHDQLLERRREHTPVKPTTLAQLRVQVKQHNSLQHSLARNLLQLSMEHILAKNSKDNKREDMVNLRTDSPRMVAQKDIKLVVVMDNSNRKRPMVERLLEEDTSSLSKDMLLVA